MTSQIDPTKPAQPEGFAEDLRANLLTAANEITALQAAVAGLFISPVNATAPVTIQTDAGNELTIAGSNGTAKGIWLNTALTGAAGQRWGLFANAVGEGAGNSGSDLVFNSYDNTGTTIAPVLTLTRASGLATFGFALTVTGRATLSGGIAVTGAVNYASPGAAKVGTTYTVTATDYALLLAPTGTMTLTLPAAGTNSGRIIALKLTTAFAVNSATANVVPLIGGAAAAAILTAASGKYCSLMSDGANWQIMQAN